MLVEQPGEPVGGELLCLLSPLPPRPVLKLVEVVDDALRGEHVGFGSVTEQAVNIVQEQLEV